MVPPLQPFVLLFLADDASLDIPEDAPIEVEVEVPALAVYCAAALLKGAAQPNFHPLH